MNIETRIINTEEAFQNDPYHFLGVLLPEQIKQTDQRGIYYEIAKDAEVLIEGQMLDGKHKPLVIGPLNEPIKIALLGVGRNVRNPENASNVSAVFSYDLSQLDQATQYVRGLRQYRGQDSKNVAVQLFFLRHDYFEVDHSKLDLTGINGIHVVANLPKDPRADIHHQSSKYRFGRPGISWY